ncbi:hypothetical protein H6761_03880 [Candidatus Nomurabacteria bacterium]|nr:hypothetical protein [Candidatus Nomurabacteria bacterium]
MYDISREEQMQIIKKLYRSYDAMSSTKKFNEKYQDKIGKMGDHQMLMSDFCRKMRQTDFSDLYVERFTKEVTGQEVDLDTV